MMHMRLSCNSQGSAAPPRSASFYQSLFYQKGTSGLADFFDKVSYGAINLDGSVVRGW